MAAIEFSKDEIKEWIQPYIERAFAAAEQLERNRIEHLMRKEQLRLEDLLATKYPNDEFYRQRFLFTCQIIENLIEGVQNNG